MYMFVLSRGCMIAALVHRVDPAEVMAGRHAGSPSVPILNEYPRH